MIWLQAVTATSPSNTLPKAFLLRSFLRFQVIDASGLTVVAGAVPLNLDKGTWSLDRSHMIQPCILVHCVHIYWVQHEMCMCKNESKVLYRKFMAIILRALFICKKSRHDLTTRYSLHCSHLIFNQKPPVSQLIGRSIQKPFLLPIMICLKGSVVQYGTITLASTYQSVLMENIC